MTQLIPFSTGSDMRRLQREFDRMFDDFFPRRNGEGETAAWTPRVDLEESEEAFMLHLDVPGVKKDEISINFENGTLTVSGERKLEQQSEERNFTRIERSFGRFLRSFTLPKDVKEDGIAAAYENGVLIITVPKAEKAKPRRIQVK